MITRLRSGPSIPKTPSSGGWRQKEGTCAVDKAADRMDAKTGVTAVSRRRAILSDVATHG